MKEIDNTPIEDLNVDWGNPDGTGKKAKSLEQVQAFLKKHMNNGYKYISTATPSTTPVTLTGDEKVFYIATEEGDYTNFGLETISELSVIKSENGSWKVEGLGVSLAKIDDLIISPQKIASTQKIERIYDRLNSLIGKKRIDLTVRGQYFLYSDGSLQYNDTYSRSCVISIPAGAEVHVVTQGSGVANIVTCDSIGYNIVVQAGTQTFASIELRHQVFHADEDCYVMVCAKNNADDTEVYYTEDIQFLLNSMTMTKKTFIAKLRAAIIDPKGFLYQYTMGSNSPLLAMTNLSHYYWLEIGDYEKDTNIICKPYDDINEGETLKIFFFDEKYSAVSSAVLSKDTEYSVTIPSNVRYVRIGIISDTELPYSERYIEVSLTTNILQKSFVRNFLETDDYILENSKIRFNRFYFDVKFNGKRHINNGWFFPSFGYKPYGKPSKLAVLYTGSDSFKFEKEWNAFSDNYHSIVFSLVHSGYSVALCSCLTTLYGTDTNNHDCSGDQLSINAYDSLYDFVTENFNISNEVYMIGYSNGGMPVSRYAILDNIPVKAIAGGAIVSDLISLFRILGFPNDINRIMHNCGVPEDVGISHGGPYFTEEDYIILKSQEDHLKNYSPLFMSCEGLQWGEWIDAIKNVPFPQFETNSAISVLMENVKIHTKVPIKMWHARDDVNVSYGLEKFFIEAVNRGGGVAFMRTMPNNSGKHAMGNYGDVNSLKIQDYHFKDGTVAPTTVFMAEVIDWFEEW